MANFAMAWGFGKCVRGGGDKIAAELPEAYFYMGEAYRKKNFMEDARDCYETFLKIPQIDINRKRLAEEALKKLKKNEGAG